MASPHERWTGEHGSAPIKCAAHRNVKPLGRTSNLALRQQSLKDHQQLEAGVPKISKIPLVSPLPEIANAGGLLSYGPDFRRSASLVDQIPKGSKAWRSPNRPSQVMSNSAQTCFVIARRYLLALSDLQRARRTAIAATAGARSCAMESFEAH